MRKFANGGNGDITECAAQLIHAMKKIDEQVTELLKA
jgi:hypothetical protein